MPRATSKQVKRAMAKNLAIFDYQTELKGLTDALLIANGPLASTTISIEKTSDRISATSASELTVRDTHLANL